VLSLHCISYVQRWHLDLCGQSAEVCSETDGVALQMEYGEFIEYYLKF